MSEFRRVEAIDFDFFPKDLYLINKQAEKFNTLTLIYGEYSFDELIATFFKCGNKRFKSKKQRLEFLAVYQAILNHEDLMPTQDKLQAGVQAELFRLGYEVYENEGNTEEQGEEIQTQEDDQEEAIKNMNNYDVQYKWSRILARIEEVKDYAEEVIQNIVEKYEDKQHNIVIPSSGEEEYVIPKGKPKEDCMYR